MSQHILRLAAPKSWPIKRKNLKYIAKPSPGPHKLENCITLNLILKDLLKYAETEREVKKILNSGKVLVNKLIRKDHRFPVGIIDTIEIPSLNEYYRLLFNKKGKFILKKILKEDAELKLSKIIGKTMIKNKKIQINLYDGGNIIVGKDEYKLGDTILTSNNEIKKHLKLEKGALIYLIGGKHVGSVGKIQDFHKVSRSQDKIIFKIGNELHETSKEYAFVIDKPI